MRYKYLQVSTFIFLEICKHGTSGIEIIENALPEDTKFVRAGHDNLGSLFLVLESNEWPELSEGDEIPRVNSPLFNKKQ